MLPRHDDAGVLLCASLSFTALLLCALNGALACPGVTSFMKFVFQEPLDTKSYAIGVLYEGLNEGLTAECVKICREQAECASFTMDYSNFVCRAFRNAYRTNIGLTNSSTSNLFEKVCYENMSEAAFAAHCGADRLWSVELTVGAYLDGYASAALFNATRAECAAACVSIRTCRSASHDSRTSTCRLSKENRWTQRQAFREAQHQAHTYLENQCAASGNSRVINIT